MSRHFRARRQGRSYAHHENSDSLVIEQDSYLNTLLAEVELSLDNSFGNCGEMARVAAYAIFKAFPHVNAEYYQVKNGDHCIVVVGRDPNSNPYLPSTWGEDCFICDPWSNRVYRASEYKKYFKNAFCQTEEHAKRAVHSPENLDETVYSFGPVKNYNSTYMNKFCEESSVDRLIKNYQHYIDKLIQSLQVFIQEIKLSQSRLLKKHGQDDSKYKIIASKVNELESLLKQIKPINHGTKNYFAAHESFSNDLENKHLKIKNAVRFNSKNLEALSKARYMGLFKPITMKEINKAKIRMEEQLTSPFTNYMLDKRSVKLR